MSFNQFYANFLSRLIANRQSSAIRVPLENIGRLLGPRAFAPGDRVVMPDGTVGTIKASDNMLLGIICVSVEGELGSDIQETVFRYCASELSYPPKEFWASHQQQCYLKAQSKCC